MSLLSSTVNDGEEESNKENVAGQVKNGGNGGNGGSIKRHWKLYASSSDEALRHRHFAATSPDPLTLLYGSSPVLKPNLVKDGSFRDIEPLLAASPNILGNNKSVPRIVHPKSVGNILGAVHCASSTPPHRAQTSGSCTPNSEPSSGGSRKGELFRAHAAPPTIAEEGEYISVGIDARRPTSAHKHINAAGSSSNLDQSAPNYLSPVSGNRNSRMTPSTPRTNPFDIGDPSELTMSIVSPSVFGTSKERSNENGTTADREPSVIVNEDDDEKEQSTKPFRWSIDQLAILYPADIDITDKEVSKQEIYRTPDVEYEKKVEAAIDEYFSQNYIVPSPWVGQSGAKHQSRLTDLMECNNGSPDLNSVVRNGTAGNVQDSERLNGTGNSAMNVTTNAVGTSRLSKSANTSTARVSVREVACQTKLTIPLDVDLEKILAGYMTTTEEVVVVNSNDSRIAQYTNTLGLPYALPRLQIILDYLANHWIVLLFSSSF